jgi:hypothetical protein
MWLKYFCFIFGRTIRNFRGHKFEYRNDINIYDVLTETRIDPERTYRGLTLFPVLLIEITMYLVTDLLPLIISPSIFVTSFVFLVDILE